MMQQPFPQRLSWILIPAALFGLLLVMGSLSTSQTFSDDAEPVDRKQLWKEVDEARNQGLPQTAIEKLKLIYTDAINASDLPDAVKALGMQLMAEGSTEDPAAVHMIQRLEAAIPESPETIKPILKLLLADWHFSYYQQNRWQFAQRDRTSVAPSDDIQTWDLPRILSYVDQLYREALESAEPLKKIPVQQYQTLLTSASVPDSHRPTLYDFVAHQALQFYQMDEQIIRRQGAFDISADSPIFADDTEFLAWTPDTSDDASYLVHAIQILQSLTRFHSDDQDPTAALDLQLTRLQFAQLVSVGSETQSRYRSALQRFADQHVNHELSSVALARLAQSLFSKGDYVKAHQIATVGWNRFPDSLGGRMCFNQIQDIEQEELNIQTESTWNEGSANIEVSHRNVKQVHFRLLPFDFANWEQWGRYREPQNMPHEERLALFKKDPVKQWQVDVENNGDYQPGHLSTKGQFQDLPSGCYLLLASHDADFRENNNYTAISSVWISRLGLLLDQDRNSLEMQAQVVDAITGEPAAGAAIRIHQWVQDGRNSKSQLIEEVKADDHGMFQVKRRDRNPQLKIDIQQGDQKLGTMDQVYYYGGRNNDDVIRNTIFFTDRSIYRPGQTVHFKGILLQSDRKRSRYQTTANQKVKVVFWDANGQEIESLNLTSSDMGSISGSFTAPADRGTGSMRISCESSNYPGNARVAVEEYKRPKFQVEIQSPETQFRLLQPVDVKGKATAYTGAPIDGAKVSWRVVRNVRYPDWWMWRCWYCPPITGSAQEIAHGNTTTDVDGSFQVTFPANPDLSVDRESQPIFTYSVYADVTDTTGETRSASYSVSLGYTSLQASLSVEEAHWLTPQQEVAVQGSVSTLDGVPQAAKGNLVIQRLKQPETVPQAQLPGLTALRDQVFARLGQNGVTIKPGSNQPDLTQIQYWEKGEEVSTEPWESADGKLKKSFALGAGAYCATLTTADDAGNPVTTETRFLVFDPSAQKLDIKLPSLVRIQKASVEPGETFRAVWGTGYESGRAMIRWYHRGQLIHQTWTDPGTTQTELTFTPEEKHRGGLNVLITYVHENRSYITPIHIDVPWSNKKLEVKWEHFVSKLTPGGKETWTAVVKDPQGKGAIAEMVATLYDASLDAFSPHYWQTQLGSFYNDYQYFRPQYSNHPVYFYPISHWQHDRKNDSFSYRHWIGELVLNPWQWASRRTRGFAAGGGAGGMAMAPASAAMEMDSLAADGVAEGAPMAKLGVMEKAEAPGEALQQSSDKTPDVNLDQVTARKNLQETAFFLPHLISDKDGTIRIEFEVPEALTQWKFMGLAHDSQLRSGFLKDEAVTRKDLMVQPNPPRFLREGDTLQFSAKISNQSATMQTGKVRLQLQNLQTGEAVDSLFGNESAEQTFDIPAGQSRSVYWTLNVPDYVGVLGYKVVGATQQLSDGEEGYLPVLSNRILVTESLPLPIRGIGTKEFQFESLLKSAESDSLKSQTLTVQMTSNPSWYAVMALPYLMEYPHQCSEQVFNRLYANALARHIVKSDDRIAQVFQQWRGTEALDSPLEKNQDLRNVLIEQSPWLLDAKKESQARRNVGILFENNRMDTELKRALKQLSEMQYSDGAWPWFPSGPANDYITLYVTTGFGRLRHLSVDLDVSPALKSLDRLDDWLNQIYQDIIRRNHLDRNNLSNTICLYLYGRSFFLEDKPVDEKYRPAYDYFVAQAKTYWVKLAARQPQGHLAIALHRNGDRETAKKIMASLTERSKSSEEMGMFWLTPENSWWWYQAPIETQALMIEAYDEVLGDRQAVEDLKVWLLKQKQTQNWKSTKATADAVYALLLRGTSQLASTKLVQVELNGQEVRPEATEAGTGFYEQRFLRGEIQAEQGNIKVTKSDEGVAWGSVHWQYLEDISKIKAYEGTPLTLKKSLYRKVNSPDGPVIEPVNGPVQVGDEIVVRVELRTDRDMEYVHLKDYRGSGTEPVNVLSRYKFQDGLYYYESTRDTASHFFIDYLPRGTYVFEYSVRIQHRGEYESGIAELQCMYAPEFNSHSGNVTMTVQ